MGKTLEERYRVRSDQPAELTHWDPDDRTGVSEDPKTELTALVDRLSELQERVYAEHKHKILVILQATDTGGKDGTIRAVFSGVNPQGVRVWSFKAPTAEELDHDFLWRTHAKVPGKGEIAVFNRSYYEEVLVVMVHEWIDKARCERRYRQIRHFEEMLVDEGTTLVKVFLHISKDEQKKRLEKRLTNVEKNWKFNSGDLEERRFWDKYQKAYARMLTTTSTEAAPWYVVPANHKPTRNVIVAQILLDRLEALKIEKPQPNPELAKVIIE